MRGGRRGQATTEYLLLLCATLTVAIMTGSFLQRYGRQVTERVLERVLETAIAMASP